MPSKFQVRVKHTPATPPELYRFEADMAAGGYRMEGNSDRLWTAAEVLEAFDVVAREDLYRVAKEARKELALSGAVTDAAVVAVARAERARNPEAPARAEPKRPEDSVPAAPAPAAGRKRSSSRE